MRRCPNARFVRTDMRDLASIGGPFDAIICLWQSFGYFDSETNVGFGATKEPQLVGKVE